jgi:hypothetical protein
MNSQNTGSKTARSKFTTALVVALGLYVALLLTKRGQLLFEHLRGHLLAAAEFTFFAPTTNGELFLIATIVVTTALHIASLRRKAALQSIELAEIRSLARTHPFSLASASAGWSIGWPLLVLNMVFQVAVLYVYGTSAYLPLHLIFYVVLLGLALYLFRHEMLRRYGVSPVGGSWSFLWRVVAVGLLARLVLVESIELEHVIDELLLAEGLAAKAAVALMQCLALGWAAHRSLARHSQVAGKGSVVEA